MTLAHTSKLGIIAGSGQLPERIIEACQQQNRPYTIIAFINQTDPHLVENRPHKWTMLGQTKQILDHFRECNVHDIVMVGSIKRPSWSELKPDSFTASWLTKHIHKIFGDDSLLRAVITLFEDQGFAIKSAEEIIGELLLAPSGQMGRHSPDAQAKEDIALGLKVATLLGACDVGQAVVIQQGLILGVEAIEGTKALIQRCHALKRNGPGGVLVKVTKPKQELRVDRPTVGLDTLRDLKSSGLRGLAIEAFGVIMLDRQEMIRYADANELFLTGIKREI